ncbi:hypothetical protein TrRE_jg11042, partial [Triparma retinervis]
KCRFGEGNDVSAGYISATEVVCVSPAASSAGAVDVAVSNNGVDFDDSSILFEYKDGAAVGSISPTSGSIVGGTIVTVTGANFEDTNDLACLFGTLESPAAVYKSSTEVECEAPLSSSSGFVSVEVSTNGV